MLSDHHHDPLLMHMMRTSIATSRCSLDPPTRRLKRFATRWWRPLSSACALFMWRRALYATAEACIGTRDIVAVRKTIRFHPQMHADTQKGTHADHAHVTCSLARASLTRTHICTKSSSQRPVSPSWRTLRALPDATGARSPRAPRGAARHAVGPPRELADGNLAARAPDRRPEHLLRIGRSPARLLLAAGRAALQALLPDVEEEPCAHGELLRRAHGPCVHANHVSAASGMRGKGASRGSARPRSRVAAWRARENCPSPSN